MTYVQKDKFLVERIDQIELSTVDGWIEGDRTSMPMGEKCTVIWMLLFHVLRKLDMETSPFATVEETERILEKNEERKCESDLIRPVKQ